MTTISKNTQLLATAKTIKGTSFIGIRNYENQQGEVSNYTILVGANRENMLKKDLKSLIENKKNVVAELLKEFSIEVITKAYDNVYTSLEKRLATPEEKETLREQGDKTIKASDSQNEAYHFLANGVKLHIETLQIHICGYVMSKKVLVPIDYENKKDTRRDLTKCQDKIKSFCKFKNEKYREFKFSQAELKMQGINL